MASPLSAAGRRGSVILVEVHERTSPPTPPAKSADSNQATATRQGLVNGVRVSLVERAEVAGAQELETILSRDPRVGRRFAST
jgi:hypothetical protein